MENQSITREKSSLARLALAGIMAGGMLLTACEKSITAPATDTKAGITSAKTVAAFQTECTKIGGVFASHECKGLNECKGHSFQDEKGVNQHSCKGTSACKGGSCIEG